MVAPQSAKAVHITRRERQIIELLKRAFTDRMIATELGISAESVHVYLGRLYPKLGVHSRSQVIVMAFTGGLENK